MLEVLLILLMFEYVRNTRKLLPCSALHFADIERLSERSFARYKRLEGSGEERSSKSSAWVHPRALNTDRYDSRLKLDMSEESELVSFEEVKFTTFAAVRMDGHQ